MAGFGAVNQQLIVRDGEPLTANAQLKLATAKEEGEGFYGRAGRQRDDT